MKMTLKSETSSKITFSYDRPVGAVEGYLYYADGKRVSRTLDPDKLTVTFGKVASGKYAVEAVGFWLVERAEWPEVTVPPPAPIVPTKPGNLRATNVQQTSLLLQWDPSTDDVAVISYRVYRAGVLLGEGPGSGGGFPDEWQDMGLTCDTSYTYGVEAVDGAGNVSPRATIAVLTAACDPAPPPPPTGGSVVKVSGTIQGSTLLQQIAAAPVGAVTVQPADGQTSFTVPDEIFQLGRDNVTFKNGKFQNFCAIDKGSGFVLDGCSFHGIGLRFVHNWTIRGCTVAINGQAWNSQWFGPIAGSWIEGCKNWQMLNSTFSGHYDAVTTSRHSEAWFICAGNDGGLIKGCTFDNGGTTGHLFWTWFSTTANGNPTNICVTGCKFTRVHNPWFHTQVHGDISGLSLNNRIDPTTCTFDSSATNICGNQGGIVSDYVKACTAP